MKIVIRSVFDFCIEWRFLIISGGLTFLATILFFSGEVVIPVWGTQILADKFGQYGAFTWGTIGLFLTAVSASYAWRAFRDDRLDNVYQQIHQSIDSLIADVNSLQLRFDEKLFLGIDALYHFNRDAIAMRYPNSVLDHLNGFLLTADQLLRRIRDMKAVSGNRRSPFADLEVRMAHVINSKITWPVDYSIYKPASSGGTLDYLVAKHLPSLRMFDRYERLSKDALQVLAENEAALPGDEGRFNRLESACHRVLDGSVEMIFEHEGEKVEESDMQRIKVFLAELKSRKGI